MPSPHVGPRMISKRREKITSLPLYHSGHLQKKFLGEKDFHSFYGELRGSTIFLYSNEKQDMYSEKLELQNMKSMVMDKPATKGKPAVYTLMLLSETVQLQIDSLDAGEEWKGFIMTIGNLAIPSKLQLLPGQMLMLEEILKMERERIAKQSQSACRQTSSSQIQASKLLPMRRIDTYDYMMAVGPLSGFHFVSREQAERMLEESPNYGSIILRPAADHINYAITLRQVFCSEPITKHFKVRAEASRFVIELDSPVIVSSLSAVLEYFVTQSSGALRPYIESQHYETRLEFPPVNPVMKPNVTQCAADRPMIHSPFPPETYSPSPLILPKPMKKQEEEPEYIQPDVPQKELKLCFKRELEERLKKRKGQLSPVREGMEGCHLSDSLPASELKEQFYGTYSS